MCRLVVAVAVLLVAGCGRAMPSTVLPTASLASTPATPQLPAASGRIVFPPSFTPAGVAFVDAETGFIIGSANGAGGDVGVTRDGGATWAWTRVSQNPIAQVVVSGRDVWALSPCPDDVRCASGLYRSRDVGASWDRVTSKAGGLVGAMRITLAGDRGWALGFRAAAGDADPDGIHLRETRDGGLTWVERRDPCAQWWPFLTDVRFVNPKHGWLLCGGEGSGTMGPAAVFESLDAGATWTLRSANGFWGGPSAGVAPGGPVGGLAMSPGGTGWIWQGRSGTARTADGGRTWANGPPGKPEEVFVSSIWTINDDEAFAIVFDGDRRVTGIIGTEDAGVTWHDIAVQPVE